MIRLTQKDQIEPYLRDGSQFHGSAEGVALPATEKEVSEFLKEAHAKKIPVTISGGKTGLTGAAVPEGGWVLSTEKLNKILEINQKEAWARLEPALYLKDLQQTLAPQKLFYPPDPTGPKAFLGGTVSTNASGPNGFKYGATRPYVRRLRMVLADGEILDLRRRQIKASREGILEIPLSSRKLKALIPRYQMPSIKHAGGYFSKPGMDAIDLMIGSEGTLGIVTEIEVALIPSPEEILSFVVFFRTEEDAWHFASRAREISLKNKVSKEGIETRMIEYFDTGSLEFLRPVFSLIPTEARACLFIEQEVGARSPRPQWGGKTPPLQTEWHSMFEKEESIIEIWEGDTLEKQNDFRTFRSALPLAVREFLGQHSQIKVGTDTSVPHEHFQELMLFHRHAVEKLGITNVTFGHIGESHVHLNLLPRSDEESQKARALYPELVKKAVSLGGTFSAEHGVGKLKHRYLAELYGERAIGEMRALKQVFDPHQILGRGNIFEIQ